MEVLQGFGYQFLLGAGVTLAVALGAMVLGTAMGLVFALFKVLGGPLLRRVADFYTTVVRGIPDLLVIFLVYFGGTLTISWLLRQRVEIDSFAAGCVALGVVFGAYVTEIFRGAILGVPRGQVEAAQALGLRRLHVLARVVLPQAWRIALPPYGNQLIVLLKQTSLVSIVGLEEIMRVANIAVGATNAPFTFYLAAATVYLVLSGALTLVLQWLERAASRSLAHR